jgi:Rieske Fe-S protein
MSDRRVFVRVAGLAATGALAGCGPGTPGAPSRTPASPGPTVTPNASSEVRLALMPVGATETVSVNLVGGLLTPLAVTRTGDTQVVAVSRICTHEGCTIGLPAGAGGTLDCPCHGSRFRVDGTVVNGPANRPLGRFAATIEAAEVVVRLG